MNERLIELHKQADKWSAEEYHQLFLANESPDRQKLFNQKFAELIVRECVWQVVKDDKVPQDIQVLIGERFKQHFGVEE